MKLNGITKKLHAKAKLLFPDCEKWTVNLEVNSWHSEDDSEITYVAFFIGRYKHDELESKYLRFEGSSVKSIFNQISRHVDDLPKRINIDF